jgi:hypothetical protein
MALCKVCNKDKTKILNMKDSQYIYSDETGKKWHGKICPNCISQNTKDKRGVEEKLKVCPECNNEFLTTKAKQVVCSYPCRLRRVAKQVTDRRRHARQNK